MILINKVFRGIQNAILENGLAEALINTYIKKGK